MAGSPVSIRPALPADYDAVVTVWKEGWDSIGINNTADEAVTWDMLRARLPEEVAETWSLYVAEVAGEIVGMLALEVGRHWQGAAGLLPGHDARRDMADDSGGEPAGARLVRA